MPKKRLSMQKIQEVLRLKFEQGHSNRTISRSCGIGRSTVNDYLQRAKRAGTVWPPHEALSEQALEEALFPPQPQAGTARMIPDFASGNSNREKTAQPSQYSWGGLLYTRVR